MSLRWRNTKDVSSFIALAKTVAAFQHKRWLKNIFQVFDTDSDIACNAGVFWRARLRVWSSERHPGFKLGRGLERDKMRPREWELGWKEKKPGRGRGRKNTPAGSHCLFEKRRSPTNGVCDWCGLKLNDWCLPIDYKSIFSSCEGNSFMYGVTYHDRKTHFENFFRQTFQRRTRTNYSMFQNIFQAF